MSLTFRNRQAFRRLERRWREERLSDRLKEALMGATADKMKGMVNEAAGNVKQGVGKAVGSEKLQAEGIAQEMTGKGQMAMGKAKQAAKNAVNKIADLANRNL